MRVYFVRHGESVDAGQGVHQRSEAPLSELGEKQAAQISMRLNRIDIDKIYSSTMRRAEQTAKVVARDKGMKVEYSDLIVELKKPSVLIGKWEEGVITKELKEYMRKYFGTEIRHSDEENFSDVKARLVRFIEVLEKEKGEAILVVTHGYVIRFIFGLIAFGNSFNWEMAMNLFKLMKTGNTGLTVYEYSGGEWRLITWNDIAHLGE